MQLFDSPRWFLIGTLALAGNAVSQTTVQIPDNLTSLGTCNVLPFGPQPNVNQIYQTLLTKAQLGNTAGTIEKIGFAACGAGTHSFTSLTITMDHFSGTSGLSATFAANLSSQAKTVFQGDHYAHPLKDQWNDITLTQPFAWDPSKGDLVIEIRVVGSSYSDPNTQESGFHRSTTLPIVAIGYDPEDPVPTTGYGLDQGLKIQITFAAESSDPMAELIDAVEAFVEDQTLSSFQGALLTTELASAQAYIDADQPNAARLQLQIFQFTVTLYVYFNVLSPAQGATLTDGAQAVIDSL